MKVRQLLSALAGLGIAGLAHAQAYPNHPVRVIVPWPPGQATDLAARIIADRLSQALGQPFVIDNKPGAGGKIGTDLVAKAAPDGYTLLAASSGPVSIAPNLEKLSYAPLTDLAPVSVIAVNPFALVTFPNFPANNAKEFIAKLKAAPDKYTFASSGTGATAHLITAYFNSQAGVHARHVPYKGSVPALTDIMGGQVDYTCETVPSVVAHVKSGKLKTFGVTFTKRSSAMPDVPTISEVTGIPNFNIGSWIGYEGPAGLPKDIAEKLSAAVKTAVAASETRDHYLPLGLDQMSNTPAEMGVMLRREQDRFAAIVKENHITIQ
ncbi:MAG TPA: tripartite tricarboxylate transporter substrate binding protein [Burkholderiales bacterium]